MPSYSHGKKYELAASPTAQELEGKGELNADSLQPGAKLTEYHCTYPTMDNFPAECMLEDPLLDPMPGLPST